MDSAGIWGNGLLLAARSSMTCPRLRPRVSANYRLAVAVRTAYMRADEVHDQREGRSNSAPKKAAAAFKIAFARFSSAFSR